MSSYDDRLADHSIVTAALGSMSDADLVALLDQAGPDSVGIGGRTRAMRIAGKAVFVKLVRVTDLERDAGPGCTANLFDLPTWYQYGVGVGSTGFNAWRELAAHQIVSDWVVHDECANFPLLYHWRELPQQRSVDQANEAAAIGPAVRFWRDSPAVETRLRALADSSTVVALFVEHVPFVLSRWLSDQLTASSEQAETAVMLVERQLLAAVVHLRSQGMTHFDAHLDNVLTDGQRIYLSDFGLATARRFQLTDAERRFVELTADHDHAYCAAALVNTIVGALLKFSGPGERNNYVRRCAHSGRAAHLTGPVADTVVRNAGIATIVNDFYWQLHGGDQTARYPAADIAVALADTGLPGQ